MGMVLTAATAGGWIPASAEMTGMGEPGIGMTG